MKSARYTMDFQNGVKFDMAVVMSDTVTAATAATLMKGVSMMRKNSGSPLEKTALDSTTIDSNSGTLTVGLLVVGQPVFKPVDLPALPIRCEISCRGKIKAGTASKGFTGQP